MKTNCGWGEGLVGDVAESFGDLNSIFCLVSGDKMDSMTNIGRGKLEWATTNGLLKPRMLFRVKSRDGGRVNTSSSCYGPGGMASIKHSEDCVFLSRGKGYHDDGG